MAQLNQTCVSKLKSMHEHAQRDNAERKREFLHQFELLIRVWEGELPDLLDIFCPKEIDWFIEETLENLYFEDFTQPLPMSVPLINFVVATGYKDEPDLDQDGKPILLRDTPIHHAARNGYRDIIPNLFKIYDANYIDEDGLTHLHVACMSRCHDVVRKFLELGQDPNFLCHKSGESPLYSALDNEDKELVELLLKSGANPNLANVEGETPLHIICVDSYCYYDEMAKMLFEISDERYQPVQIDARDNEDNTPLHLALGHRGYPSLVEFLLRNGANPNAVNEEGSTPLHIICEHNYSSDYVEKFFKINDELNQPVLIDARDKLGRTPLEWAVTSLLPETIDVLVDRGADLSSFVFPTGDHFVELFRRGIVNSSRLRLASGILIVVEHLEKRGYELNLSEALTIMNTFAKHGWFQKSAKLEAGWYDEFAIQFKGMIIKPNLSVYDLMLMRPEKAAKLLTYTDYQADSIPFRIPLDLSEKHHLQACALHLFEIMYRRFLRRWALDSLLELTSYKLPIICCEEIIHSFMNQDLYHICLAAADQSSPDLISDFRCLSIL